MRYDDDPSGETRPFESFATRRADALAQLAETCLAQGPKSSCTADRYHVVVHVSAETLKSKAPDEDVSAETPDLGRTGTLPPIPDGGDPREWLQDVLDEPEIDSNTGVTR